MENNVRVFYFFLSSHTKEEKKSQFLSFEDCIDFVFLIIPYKLHLDYLIEKKFDLCEKN